MIFVLFLFDFYLMSHLNKRFNFEDFHTDGLQSNFHIGGQLFDILIFRVK